jgi:hypothetical protein
MKHIHDVHGGKPRECDDPKCWGSETDSQRIAEFREKFVEPMDKDLRVITGNNEPCIFGLAKDAESWISTTLAEVRRETIERVEKEVIGEDMVLEEVDKIMLPRTFEVADTQNKMRKQQRLALDQMKEEK